MNGSSGILVIVLIGVLIILVIFLAFYLSPKFAVRRKLKKIPGKKISQFFNGDVARFTGHIEFAGENLIGPISGRACAYYHTLVEQRVSSGKNSNWRKIIEEKVFCNFFVVDGRYRALVELKDSNTKTYIVKDKTFHSGFLNDAKTTLEEYLRKHNHNSVNWIGLNKTLRYNEGVLEENEKIVIAGKGEWKEARDLGLPENFGRILHIVAPAEHPIYLTDDPTTIKKMPVEEELYTRDSYNR